MRQSSIYIAIAFIAVGISSCGFFGSGGDEVQIPEENVGTPEQQAQQPNPTTVPVEGEQAQVDGGENLDPLVIEVDSTVEGTLPLDLIPSTDPNARAAQVERERADPFDLLPTTPVVDIPIVEVEVEDIEEIEEGELAPIPELVPGQPVAPAPLIPELAQAIAVTGVVQLGNVSYAIVDAPNEPHSRYVREGQFLSNGEVLVKQINLNPGGDPVVIFEQFGIEVATAVGTGGIPEDSAIPTAVAIFNAGN